MSKINIAICVITFKRPEGLRQLLESLQMQVLKEPEKYNVRIVLVDNECSNQTKHLVENVIGPYPISYDIEREQGIPFARQKTVNLAWSDHVLIFVDDDEIAPEGWLQTMLSFWEETGSDVVTGPVKGFLPDETPVWALYSDLYDSTGKHASGDHVAKAYTGNTLVTQKVFQTVIPAFHEAFRYTGSSDIHFFQRVVKSGFKITWCEEAVIHEDIPLSRITWGWLIKRAFRAGSGDTISRLLIAPNLKTVIKILFYALARLVTGVVYSLGGLLSLRWNLITKGIRRLFSSMGAIAGLFGVNYNEYKNIHGK